MDTALYESSELFRWIRWEQVKKTEKEEDIKKLWKDFVKTTVKPEKVEEIEEIGRLEIEWTNGKLGMVAHFSHNPWYTKDEYSSELDRYTQYVIWQALKNSRIVFTITTSTSLVTPGVDFTPDPLGALASDHVGAATAPVTLSVLA